MPDESATPDLVVLAQRFDDGRCRRDFESVMIFYTADAVASFGVLGVYEGHAAMRRFYEDRTGA